MFVQAKKHPIRAVDSIQALFRGEDTPTAEAGALLIVEFFALVRSFTTGKAPRSAGKQAKKK